MLKKCQSKEDNMQNAFQKQNKINLGSLMQKLQALTFLVCIQMFGGYD